MAKEGFFNIDSDCIVCGKELVYRQDPVVMTCYLCSGEFSSNVSCYDNHYVCDSCHSSDAFDFIERTCANSDSVTPVTLATQIMRNPAIKLHGPEHHFLVPAVLLTAYYNKLGDQEMKKTRLKVAHTRSKNILGGFCGFYGTCGAGIGTGIFMSIIQNSTPLSVAEWRSSNMLTSESLANIASKGGPRCCKRDTWIAIGTTISYLKKNLNVILPEEKPVCLFHSHNRECLAEKCDYFPVE